MRKRHALKLLLTAVACCLLLGWGAAQGPGEDVLYFNKRHFRIPFTAGAGKQRLKQLQLYISTDQGRSWQQAAIAPPDQDHFRYICERDGLYWFAVQTLDQDGRYFPASMEHAQPSMKLIVDTQPPAVQLRPLPPRGSEVGVAWEVRDENLDMNSPDSTRLEYRPANGPTWIGVPASLSQGQQYWVPEGSAALEVRLRVRDRAGNVGEGLTNLGPGQHDAGPFANPGTARDPEPGVGLPVGYAGSTNRRLVNSKRISLNYELDKVGPSGVSTVELWFTQDGRSWNRYPLPKAEEGGVPPRPLVFAVEGEGVYGFTLVARSGVGLGERPPQTGDPPQVWIEVDLTKPVVQLYSVVVGQGADKGKLTINWSARDKNLAREPITLSYSDQTSGPWLPIAQKIANSGRHVWTMPEPVPYQFYVRVQAADLAGNIGEAVTPEMVKVDLSQPKVRILNVEPAGR